MKILVIEDEKLLADSIKAMLEHKGFQVECVYDGESGKEYAELGIYDLLILDVMMPKMDGFEVARQVRMKRCNTPIPMLTARSDVADRIAGLNAGADYYLTKPFDSGELLAIINALLRRQAGQVNEMVFGNTSLDLGTSMLMCNGNTVRLSAKEFDVMRLLLQSGKRNLPSLPSSPTSGDWNPMRWRIMWKSMWRFSARSSAASLPMCGSFPSGAWATIWR